MERLNPFIKAITVLICALIMSFNYSIYLNGFIFTLCMVLLIFFSKAKIKLIIKFIIPAFLAAISLFFTGLLFSNGDISIHKEGVIEVINFGVASYSMASFYSAIQLSTRILAFASLGLLFALSTDADEFIVSLIHQGKLPIKYAYGVSAAFHLIPKIKEEYSNTRLAFKARGIKVTPFSMKPLFAMLVNTIHWSESVAMAMESKGFDSDNERTYYQITTIKWFDLAFMILMIGVVILGFFMQY